MATLAVILSELVITNHLLFLRFGPSFMSLEWLKLPSLHKYPYHAPESSQVPISSSGVFTSTHIKLRGLHKYPYHAPESSQVPISSSGVFTSTHITLRSLHKYPYQAPESSRVFTSTHIKLRSVHKYPYQAPESSHVPISSNSLAMTNCPKWLWLGSVIT